LTVAPTWTWRTFSDAVWTYP